MTCPATIVIPLLRQVDTWLNQCVHSALTQTVTSEVIVVTSELTPASNLDVLARLGKIYPNLRLLVEDRPGSFPGAINKGIRNASADRVGLLLSDDWLEKEAIEATIQETADIVSSGYTVHFADGLTNERASKSPSTAAFHACSTLEEKANYLTHFFLFRTSAVLSAGGLDESIGNYPGIDDYDLIWTLLERGATVAFVSRRLYHYRDHEKERLTLQNADAMTRNLRKILHKHGVPENQSAHIIAKHAPWYGRPVSSVLNEIEQLNGGHAGIASVRKTAGFHLFFDLLRSAYTWVRNVTLFGGQRNLLIAQPMRNIFERLGWPASSRVAPPATVRALAKHRDPTYTPVPNRILMITSTLNRGGSERQMMATASALHDKGYDVRFLALGRTDPDTPTIEHEILKLGIKPDYHTDLPVAERAQRASVDADCVPGLYELPLWFSARATSVVTAIRNDRPAVAHCWLEMPGMIAALTSCSMGVPRVVLGQRNALTHRVGAGFTQELDDLLANAYPALAANPNAIVVNNSASAARQYEGHFGLPPNSIRVVYNGFAPDSLRKPASNEVLEFRGRWGVNGATPVVGALMRFVRNKDPELWIEVARIVAAAKPNVRFLIGGYGEMEGAVTGRIKSLGLDDRVIFVGPVEDIGLFYAAIDVVLLTSKAEGTPNVLIEAQAAGRPVVAPDVGGVSETMVNGSTGRLVAMRSAEDLAQAVTAVLEDEEWRKNACLYAKAFVAERFSVSRMLRETLALYGFEGQK